MLKALDRFCWDVCRISIKVPLLKPYAKHWGDPIGFTHTTFPLFKTDIFVLMIIRRFAFES